MTPYILMISEHHAHKILCLIDSAHFDVKVATIGAIIVFILACGIGIGFANTYSSVGVSICNVLIWLSLIFAVISGFNYFNTFRSTSLTLDGGAAHNVGCYREMQHLKHVYPHLRKHENSVTNKSLTYDTSLTKPQAIKKYKILKRCYRNPYVNSTTSIKPYVPKWWQRI